MSQPGSQPAGRCVAMQQAAKMLERGLIPMSLPVPFRLSSRTLTSSRPRSPHSVSRGPASEQLGCPLPSARRPASGTTAAHSIIHGGRCWLAASCSEYDLSVASSRHEEGVQGTCAL